MKPSAPPPNNSMNPTAKLRRIQVLEDFVCDLTLFQGLSSPTSSFPTTPLRGGSSPNGNGSFSPSSYLPAATDQ